MHRASITKIIILAGFGAGCVPELDDDLSHVASARVLAIVAEPPEAGEGDTVRLGALVAGGAAEAGQPPLFAFCHARKPLSELGPIDPACLVEGSPALEPLGRGGSVAAAIDRSACSVFGPRRPSAEAGQPAGRAADPDSTGGYYQPVLATLPGQTSVLGGVRLDCGLPGADREQVIEYNQSHRPNTNPRLERIEISREGGYQTIEPGVPFRVGAGELLELRAVWAACEGDTGQGGESGCGGAEPYVLFDPETGALVERSEALSASWYATGGDLEEPRTGPDGAAPSALNAWLAPATAGPVELWVVLRDGRGGVGYAARRFDVE